MVSDQSITVFGSIQCWDTPSSTGLQSGVILNSHIASGGKDLVDVGFSSNGFVIFAPSSNINNRSTSFFVGLSPNED